MARFLHLHTFYPDATNHLYQQTPQLKLASFDEQMSAVLADSFSAIHIFTPYLSKMGYETKFIVANNPFAQERWIRENNVPLRDKNNWVKEIAKAQIEAFNPDVLYTCDTITFDSAFFRSLSCRPKLIMGWRGADIPASIDWSEYDVILSGLPALLEYAQKLGARHGEFFFPGFPVHIAEKVAHIQPRFDIVFTGSWTTRQHHQRNTFLRHIAQQANTPGYNYSAMYYLAGNPHEMPSDLKANLGPAKFGLAMHETLRKGRINFDSRSAIRLVDNNQTIDLARDHTINMRIFETLGTGCFLLTEYFEGLKRYFEPGKELETFKDRDELTEKIRYYLDHPDERETIAQKGQLRCHAEYSMEKRAAEFDRIIQKHLRIKSTSGNADVNNTQPSSNHGPLAEMRKAIDTFVHSPNGELLSQKMQSITQKQEKEKPQKAEQLLNKSIYAFKNGRFKDAYLAATEAKNLRLNILNTDLLRAASLLNLGQPQDALQALSEELTLFPDNTSAKELRSQIMQTIKASQKDTSPV